jgi:hypothetical protein
VAPQREWFDGHDGASDRERVLELTSRLTSLSRHLYKALASQLPNAKAVPSETSALSSRLARLVALRDKYCSLASSLAHPAKRVR